MSDSGKVRTHHRSRPGNHRPTPEAGRDSITFESAKTIGGDSLRIPADVPFQLCARSVTAI
jgi:hypothetical protein